MKKHNIRAFIMVTLMCFAIGCIPVSADMDIGSKMNSTETNFVINEYEEGSNLQRLSDTELAEIGYSEDEAEAIHSFSYRDALLERAALPESKLQGLGYSREQIEFLKIFEKNPYGDYDYSVMSIELNVRQIVLVAGASSSSYKTIRYNWSWSAAPLAAFTDSVAVRWQAYDSKGHSIDTTCYDTSSTRYASVKYYNDYGLANTETISVSSQSGFSCMRANFKMSKIYKGENVWAKSGSITCKIEDRTSSAIHHIKVQATYGHSTLQPTSLSISFSGDYGVSFGMVCQNYYRTAEIRSSVVYI